MRYMGTKRRIAPLVQSGIRLAGGGSHLVDLFCGTGAIARSVAPDMSVTLNDAQAFIACMARASFCWQGEMDTAALLDRMKPHFDSHTRLLCDQYADRLVREERALADQQALAAYIQQAPHVGSDDQWRDLARSAKSERGHAHYSLTCLYFSSAYFSTRQAIALDATRYAIDTCVDPTDLDVALSAWLATASSIMNSPGHSAQFMKPSSESGYKRLHGQWKRDVWSTYADALSVFEPVGCREWRAGNRVFNRDARELLSDPDVELMGVAYADPPYTSDQYSRFYHVFETLYLYDFPESTGAGRYRSGRHVSDFSLASKVVEAVEELAQALASRGCPLVLSYPSNGLLCSRGEELAHLLAASYPSIQCIEQDLDHSRMGSSGDASTKAAREHVYVCQLTDQGS